MTKINALRRFLLPCFSPPTTISTTTITTKKRLSASLRDDLEGPIGTNQEPENQEAQESTSPQSTTNHMITLAPPRPSKTMVIGTIFGSRRGHVWFCIQHDRLSTKPLLLLELSIPTHQLVKEMQCGLVRIALECDRSELNSVQLRSVPVWTLNCNGKKAGFALRRKATEQICLMLKTMQSMTVGAGVIPAGFGASSDSEEIMYMRANYEHMVGGADSESFHLINPEEYPGQELSVFLMRIEENTIHKISYSNLPRLLKSQIALFVLTNYWIMTDADSLNQQRIRLFSMLEGKVVLCETDVPEQMQSHVMELAYQALDVHEKFDEAYGPACHCVVGKDFGSSITHLCRSFIFFRVEKMEFLIFKDGRDFSESEEEAIGVLEQFKKEKRHRFI
ncbi:unnamed protein product [Dovyalis caffra]|uniref:Uncharacterized protein n=1 Tax=Dovyalis caffra TaxID=77055 RepID=A0AAV1S1W6_9ROSI|nr:unnamed protein product [Dovyalis caffra]